MITVFVVLFLLIIIIISVTTSESFDQQTTPISLSTNQPTNSLFVPIDNNYGRYYKLRY